MNAKRMKLNRRPRPQRRAFTLVELMVVILIIAILAALIVPRIMGRTTTAKIGAAKADVASLSGAVNNFRLDCDRYPTSEEGLEALVQAPAGLEGKWKEPYVQKVPSDPWGNPYHYEYPGPNGQNSFLIESYGADGQPGGDGDNEDIVGGG